MVSLLCGWLLDRWLELRKREAKFKGVHVVVADRNVQDETVDREHLTPRLRRLKTGDNLHRILNTPEAIIDGVVERVDAGFITDFGSIPRYLKWATSKDGIRNKMAYCFHDDAYESNRFGSQKRADRVCGALLLACGTSRYEVYKVYYSLRIGGWKAFNRYRKLENV